MRTQRQVDAKTILVGLVAACLTRRHRPASTRRSLATAIRQRRRARPTKLESEIAFGIQRVGYAEPLRRAQTTLLEMTAQAIPSTLVTAKSINAQKSAERLLPAVRATIQNLNALVTGSKLERASLRTAAARRRLAATNTNRPPTALMIPRVSETVTSTLHQASVAAPAGLIVRLAEFWSMQEEISGLISTT